MKRRLIKEFLGSSPSLCYWPYETAWPYQISVFQKCEPVMYARLGFWNDDEGGLDRRLPERERLNMTSWPHVRGQPQKLWFQVRFQRLNFSLNAWRHITQERVMSRVQNSRQLGNLNLPIVGRWSNCIDKYENIKIDVMSSTLKMFYRWLTMTLIGYCIIANQLWCKHVVYQYYRFGHHN